MDRTTVAWNLNFGLQIVLPHKSNMSQKLLLKTAEVRPFSFWNRIVRFCWDRRQSGVLLGFDEVLPLWPSDVWVVERREP
jgi:hypothetical protein